MSIRQSILAQQGLLVSLFSILSSPALCFDLAFDISFIQEYFTDFLAYR